MNTENETQNLTVIKGLLRENGMISSSDTDLIITTLTGDGSSRKFWRIMQNDKHLCLAVAPPVTDTLNLAEAESARFIGMHLQKKGVRVPEQYGWNKEFGILLFEDLGDVKLHDHVVNKQQGKKDIFIPDSYYRQVVQGLAKMQVYGAVDFDPDWCWDVPRYDKNTMLERESGYFLRAFWQDYLGKKEPSGLADEFQDLAEKASQIPADFFLHRDFQSRNIMVHQGKPYVIDFQGGRLGPLGYDLASLLIDPYVVLPLDFQEELLGDYLDALEELMVVDRRKFVEEYLLLALQRNLQIIGAFAFLTRQKEKVFFEQYLQPAVASLQTLLACELFSEMRVLRETASVAGEYLG